MKRWLAILCALVPLLLGGCAGSSKPKVEHVFRYAENHVQDYPTTTAARYFSRLVEERTNGRVVINVYPNEELGDEKAVIEQLMFGGVDFTRVNVSLIAEYDSAINVLMLPYIFHDTEHMWRVLDSEIGDTFIKDFSELGVKGLGWMDAGARSFYLNAMDGGVEQALHGKVIRVQENAMMSRMVELLGAIPSQVRFSEVKEMLQTRRIDGAENNISSYLSMEHYEACPYLMEDEHTRVPEVLLASGRSMEQLSEADRQIVIQAGAEASEYERKLWLIYEEASRERVIAAGSHIISLTAEQKAEFRTLVEPLYAEFGAGYEELIEQILAK